MVLQFYLKNGEKKKRPGYLSEEKNIKKKNRATILVSVDGKGTVFPVKLKIQAE